MFHTIEYLILQYHVERDLFLERSANLFMFLSALLVSASPFLSVQAWPFLGFMIGHIIWIFAAIKIKKRTLIENNVGFLLLDLWAIGVRL